MYGSQTLHSTKEPLNRNRVSTLFGPTFEMGRSGGRTCYPGIGFEWATPTFTSTALNLTNPDRKTKSTGKRDGGADQEIVIAKISIFQDQGGDHTANLRVMSRNIEDEWETFSPNTVMEGSLRVCEITVSATITTRDSFRIRTPS
jgi:hypothetical protein